MKLTLSLLFTLSTLIGFAQTDADLAASTVQKSTIEGHIYFLASDELKGRETGTPGIDIAARYLSTTFRRYGVEPVPGATGNGYYQEVKFKKSVPASEMSVVLGSETYSDVITLTSKNIDKSAEVAFVNFGQADDYKKGVDYSGKILLAKAGSPDSSAPNALFKLSSEKQALAREAGALALIEFHTFEGGYWGQVKNYLSHESFNLADESDLSGDSKLVHMWVNASDMPDLKKTKTASVKVKGIVSDIVSSYNVVGMVEGTDPELKDEFVIYSAHYDHVGIGQPNAEGDSIYNGARDNAVGTVTVLSAAENLAKHPTKRSALFILFTAEEKGLLGSKYYVENPLIPLDKMVYCFNSDNASYNDTSKATIVGLGRTTAEYHIKDAAKAFGLTAIDDPAPEQNLFDRSDNVHFASKGIPAPTFSLGFTAFDAEVFKYYHQPSDNPDNIDYDYLEKFFSAYVLACRNIANAEETPFWVEGDKYYEAGVALYDK